MNEPKSTTNIRPARQHKVQINGSCNNISNSRRKF